jgi:hypothetical protein
MQSSQMLFNAHSDPKGHNFITDEKCLLTHCNGTELIEAFKRAVRFEETPSPTQESGPIMRPNHLPGDCLVRNHDRVSSAATSARDLDLQHRGGDAR